MYRCGEEEQRQTRIEGHFIRRRIQSVITSKNNHSTQKKTLN